ncbi:MAG: hypothetical protein IKH52_01100 [Bacteroidaceae bacterium]|nr:hypothetical protein [Bacteroidaceae bacterium]MBR7029422.1 hypothetical protein [Bacteroidaceae bacterium]
MGSDGYYWSRSLNQSIPDGAYYIDFASGGVYFLDNYRFRGHSVRPVRP